MDIWTAIRKRRSTRVFDQTRTVAREDIVRLIDAARWAPSACDRQDWKFIVIENELIRERIIRHGTASFLRDAPVWILVCYGNRTDNREYKDDCLTAAMAAQNIQLMAYSLGLGTCCVANLPPKIVLRRILGIPRRYSPVLVVAIGYPADTHKPPPRKSGVDGLISYDRFIDGNNNETPGGNGRVWARRWARWIYFRLPLPVKRLLRPLAVRYERKFDENE